MGTLRQHVRRVVGRVLPQRVLFIFTPSVITISIVFLMPLQSKGFTAWISIDDTELDAFNIEATNDGKKVTSWIASETGKASLGY